jgi:N-acetylglucosamine-6-phosphate deacetylase
MPQFNEPDSPVSAIIKFTNCRLLRGKHLVQDDLWIDTEAGKIVRGEEVFFGQRLGPNRTIDLGGKILAPGFIETQINGAYGFDLSVVPDDIGQYAKGVAKMRKSLTHTGVTSFLPTITSQRASVYQKVR